MSELLKRLSSQNNVHQAPVLRYFKLQTRPAHREAYQEIIDENLSHAIKSEPNILGLYSAHARDHINTNYVLEVFRDQDAYHTHVDSEYFKTFTAAATRILTDRVVYELLPQIILEAPEKIEEHGNSEMVVRLAKIEIKPEFNEIYHDVTLEMLAHSMEEEDGFVGCYAGEIKGRENHWRIYQVFKNREAYQHHRDSDYFKTYFETSEDWIVKRTLVDLRADTMVNKGGIVYIPED